MIQNILHYCSMVLNQADQKYFMVLPNYNLIGVRQDMSVIKIQQRDNPYAIIDRKCLDDVRLNWDARGLLAYLLSRPPNWEIRVIHLIKQAPEGRDAIYSILKKLILCGYIERVQSRDLQGQILGWDYIVYETPRNQLPAKTEVDEKGGKMLDQENPDMAKPHTAKPDALINNDINNKYLNKAAAEEGGAGSNLSDNNAAPIAAAAFEKNDEEKNSAIERLSKTADMYSKQTISPISRNQVEIASRREFTPTKPLQAESLLGSELTPAQHAWVCKVLIPFANFNAGDLSVLMNEVITVLLDTTSFKKTARDFHHKLNAIINEIKAGRWCTPAKCLLAEEQQAADIAAQENAEKQALLDEIKHYEQERTHWQKMLTYTHREEDIRLYHDIIKRCERAIASFQQKLNGLKGENAC